VTYPFDRAFGPAGILVEAVLDGVPAELRSGHFLGGVVDFTGAQRPVRSRECLNHYSLYVSGPAPDLALQLGLRP
jgi:hypothetical protein